LFYFEVEELGELTFDAGNVVREQLAGEQLAFGSFSAGIADESGGTARKSDRMVAGKLETAQGKQWNEITDVQTIGSGIKTAIQSDRTGSEAFAQFLGIGAIGYQSAPA
jgi:hypothetical protein